MLVIIFQFDGFDKKQLINVKLITNQGLPIKTL